MTIAPIASRRRARAQVVGVGILALAVFGAGVGSEPHFVDESFMVSKAFYLDLLTGKGRDDPAWLDYAAIDHPPLEPYLAGLALRAGGYRFPGRGAVHAWYDDTSTRAESPEALVVARWPSAIVGAAGCLAALWLGTLAADRRVGVVAALLLMANPLYRLLSRRAMGDVPCEAIVLLSTAAALQGWRGAVSGRSGVVTLVATAVGVGSLAGLATLAKLNGALALMIVGAWSMLAATLPGVRVGRKLAILSGAAISGATALGVIAALNPTLSAHPTVRISPRMAELSRLGIWGRLEEIARHRVEGSEGSQQLFPGDALHTVPEKVAVVAIQGFGRFGPFGPSHSDSTKRYESRQDWGACFWGPWVGAGLFWAIARGRRQIAAGQPPTAWALAVQASVALAATTAYIPLAWDRYLLPIQAPSALLAAGVAIAAIDGLRSLVVRRRVG